MELTPEMLDAILEILEAHGVTEFMGLGVAVKFATPEPVVAPMAKSEAVKLGGNTMWDDPRLWPGGVAPKFPGAPEGKK